jgi:hypothetical protein
VASSLAPFVIFVFFNQGVYIFVDFTLKTGLANGVMAFSTRNGVSGQIDRMS